jgi:RHS repeat-associated protein
LERVEGIEPATYPALGRFINADWWDPIDAAAARDGAPIGVLASAVGTNRYAYAANDPINRADPNGHLSGDEAAWVGYATTVAVGAATTITGGLAALAAGAVAVGVGMALEFSQPELTPYDPAAFEAAPYEPLLSTDDLTDIRIDQAIVNLVLQNPISSLDYGFVTQSVSLDLAIHGNSYASPNQTYLYHLVPQVDASGFPVVEYPPEGIAKIGITSRTPRPPGTAEPSTRRLVWRSKCRRRIPIVSRPYGPSTLR